MDDKRIIELFFAREERAIAETEKKYGALCRYIAGNVLASSEDVEECVSDVLLALWNAIPPDKPEDLCAYVGKSVRNRAYMISRDANAWKRGGRVTVVGEEFLSTLDDGTDLAAGFEAKRMGRVISDLLRRVGETNKDIFIMRYWLGMSHAQIMKQTGFSEGKIKMSLKRTKEKLAEALRKEGFTV
jgi:RNA polymerase sigma-70 factor (ECF subfamily)